MPVNKKMKKKNECVQKEKKKYLVARWKGKKMKMHLIRKQKLKQYFEIFLVY